MDEPPESHAAISTPMSVPDAPRQRPPERRPLRRRRPAIVGAALVLVLVIVCAAGWLAIRALSPTHRSTFGVAPIGGGQAILLTRHVDDGERTHWIELVDSDGSVVWRTDVSPLEPTEAAGFSGVAAGADRVVVIGAHHGSTAVKAFARTTGEVVWQTLVADGVAPERVGTTLLVDGPRVYAIHTRATRASERITALSLEGGESLWTMDLTTTSAEVVVLGPRRLLIAASGPLSGGGVDEVDGATGAVLRALPMKRIACATALGVVGFDLDQRVALLPPPTPEGDRAAALTELDRNAAAGPCGTRGEDIVFSARTEDGRRRHGLMRLAPQSGRLRWELDLGSVSFGANETVDGALPRFLPVAVTEDGASKIVVVDLDTGARIAEHAGGLGVTSLASADRGWVVTGATLVALDPSTGDLGRASALPGLLGRGASVAAEDVRFGALWLIGVDHERAPSDLPWAAVDLSTGRLLHANGEVEPRDVTSSGWPAPDSVPAK